MLTRFHGALDEQRNLMIAYMSLGDIGAFQAKNTVSDSLLLEKGFEANKKKACCIRQGLGDQIALCPASRILYCPRLHVELSVI